MFIDSKFIIREHCDSVRYEVDIAREIAIENIHRESNTLMREIDAYEGKCLSGWKTVKESTEKFVEDASKPMRAFLADQYAFLHSVQRRDDELILQLNSNKLEQELSDRKKELKSVIFNDKLASFIAFRSTGERVLGELAFTHITVPFKKLGSAKTDLLKPIDIRAEYDFVLSLEHGQRIVTFKSDDEYDFDEPTQISCFDRLGRLIGTEKLECDVWRENVAQSGPNQFVVCHESDTFKLSVFNSSLHCLRTVDCKNFWNICCNSKFVFGLWDTDNEDYYDDYDYDDDDDEDDDDDFNVDSDDSDEQEEEEEEEEEYSSHRIQVRHLDTLSKAFELCVPELYTIERIMADEHHVVAMTQLDKSSRQWFMTIFNLATCNKSDYRSARRGGKTKFFLAEKHVRLAFESLFLPSVFLFNGWLVVPRENEKQLIWFDKNGTRSERSTKWDTKKLKEIHSSGSSLLLLNQHDGKLWLKH